MFHTIFKIKKEDRDDIEQILSEITEKDKTFDFDIEEHKYGLFLVVSSDDKNQAHKRGMWLKYNIKQLKKCFYKVEEADERIFRFGN
jgi:hypothetical protein